MAGSRCSPSARSAGCVFKNPKLPGVPPAGKLIDRLGLKGSRHGGCAISPVHGNFIVTDGTAKSAEAPGYFPIGKTSTAEKTAAGGYDPNARISSFIGAFPGYAPRYVALVSLDDPQPSRATHGFATAGWNAAPAFADLVGRSILQEIHRCRLERARLLLLDTDLPLKAVATRSGFGDAEQLRRAFQRRYGEAPGSFRLRQRTS